MYIHIYIYIYIYNWYIQYQYKSRRDITKMTLTCENVSAHAVTVFHFDISHIFSRLHALETESSSAWDGSRDSINRGRLPTPKLRTMQTVQRTHQDRTTPATGIKPPRFTDRCGFCLSPWTYTFGISQQFHYDWKVCSQNNWLQASCLLEQASNRNMNYI